MQIGLKELITVSTLFLGGIAQFFHLEGRITVLEARQTNDRDNTKEALNRINGNFKEALDKIDKKLDTIDRKLDQKADKSKG